MREHPRSTLLFAVVPKTPLADAILLAALHGYGFLSGRQTHFVFIWLRHVIGFGLGHVGIWRFIGVIDHQVSCLVGSIKV